MERRLSREGPFVHLYTAPVKDNLVFKDDGERRMALLYLSMAAWQAGIRILCYAMMSNHFHFILQAGEEQGAAFFEAFWKMLRGYLGRHGRSGEMKELSASTKRITSLSQFRNEVAYVIRNPYVVRDDVNPLACPWTSGALYFNPFWERIPAMSTEGLSNRQLMGLTRMKSVVLPPGLTMQTEDMVNPASFVAVRLVESFFGSARRFLWWVFKNVEASVETARLMDEQAPLTDDEAWIVTKRICQTRFDDRRVADLTKPERVALAKELKYHYRVSNAQAARLSGLSPAEVDTFFPSVHP